MFIYLNLDNKTKDLINKALNFWSENTCLKFKYAKNVQHGLIFFKGDGCWSYVGRNMEKKNQPVSIGNGCEHVIN